MADSLEEIRNFMQIDQDIFTAGQPRADQFALLSQFKFEVIINLATIHSPEAIPDEQRLVMENGMAYVHIPVEWSHPTREDLNKFFYFFSSHHLFKTFCHCALNLRVSSFVFLYRVIQGKEDPEICLLDLLTIWKPNEIWTAFIDRMLDECQDPQQPFDWKVNWNANVIQKKTIIDGRV